MMDESQRERWKAILQRNGVGPYKVGEYLGGGRFGMVFDASEDGFTHSVALKVLTPTVEPAIAAEFEREGQLLESLRRASNVVDLLDVGSAKLKLQAEDLPIDFDVRFLVLELASACMSELVSYREELSWLERIRLWRGAIRGAHQMHLKKIVHRDLKSENCLIFIGAKRSTECKIGDLGRSRDLTKPALGTPQSYVFPRGDLRFAAPEFLFLQGRNNFESHKLEDLYGLGSILFELATGQALTSFVFGPGAAIIEAALANELDRYSLDLSIFRSQYDDAYDLFDSCVPVEIREKAGQLLRQLCDPDPQARLPRVGIGSRGHRATNLEWLIRQADILLRSLRSDKEGRAFVA